MVVDLCACFGIFAGGLYGRYQLKRWNIYDEKLFLMMAAGLLVIFLPGTFLMKQYGYHLLKIGRYWMILYALLLLSFLDYRKKIIPNKALLLMLGVRSVWLAAECIWFPEVWKELLVSSFVGMIGGGLIFLLAGLIARNGLGMGDVKMIGVTGYFLGFQVLMSDMLISLFLTVIAGVVNLIVRKASLRTEMPFAPFVAVGTIITILLGC